MVGRIRPGTWQRNPQEPGAIFSNNSANRNLAGVIIVPPTGNTDRVYPGEAPVAVAGQSSKATKDQIMTADKARLKSRIAAISKADMNAVELTLWLQLALAI